MTLDGLFLDFGMCADRLCADAPVRARDILLGALVGLGHSLGDASVADKMHGILLKAMADDDITCESAKPQEIQILSCS